MFRLYEVKIDTKQQELGWGEDYCSYVVAESSRQAERRARWEIEDFKKAKLRVKSIPLTKEKVVARLHTGY